MPNQRTPKLILYIILIIVLLLTAVTVYGMTRIKQTVDQTVQLVQPIHKNEIQEMTNPNLSEETVVKLRDSWTIAAFGLDSRDNKNLERGNSDVIMIVTMDGKTGAIKLASIYRDTCLKTGKNAYKKANAAYASGGPKQAVAMLNENLDLKIDDYIAVNWKSVADAINLLGGIDLSITDKEFVYLNSFITETVKSTGIPSVHLKKAGMNHLDGVQAVAYCRLRLMDDDFKRAERQQKVLNLVLQKAIHADFATLNQLIVTILPQVASSIETEDLYAVTKNITKLHIAGTIGFPEDRFVKTVDGASYVFPKDLASNVSDLHQFLYGTEDYEPSKQVKDIGIAIQNKSSRSTRKSTKKLNPAPTEGIVKETTVKSTETTIEETMSSAAAFQENATESELNESTIEATQENIQEPIVETQEQENPEHYGPGYNSALMSTSESTKAEQEQPIGPGIEYPQEGENSVTENNTLAN